MYLTFPNAETMEFLSPVIIDQIFFPEQSLKFYLPVYDAVSEKKLMQALLSKNLNEKIAPLYPVQNAGLKNKCSVETFIKNFGSSLEDLCANGLVLDCLNKIYERIGVAALRESLFYIKRVDPYMGNL